MCSEKLTLSVYLRQAPTGAVLADLGCGGTPGKHSVWAMLVSCMCAMFGVAGVSLRTWLSVALHGMHDLQEPGKGYFL